MSELQSFTVQIPWQAAVQLLSQHGVGHLGEESNISRAKPSEHVLPVMVCICLQGRAERGGPSTPFGPG